MSLSKPFKRTFLNLSVIYLQALYENPVRTKSLTSCLIALLGNYTAQKIRNSSLNYDSLAAFGIFGLFFGGSIPHYFYQFLDIFTPTNSTGERLKKFLIERFIYAPLYQFFSLYMLARLEGKDHEEAMKQVNSLFWAVLRENWKWLSILQFINLSMIPPVMRVLFINVVGFFWSIYLSNKRHSTEPTQ